MYSETDFQKLQEQLIVLKEDNYKLLDACKRFEIDTSNLKQELCYSRQELDKNFKTIEKYKRSKDISSLILENESLHVKIQNQEEEFKLQNGTIMGELQKVLSLNECFEIENKQLQAQCQGLSKISKFESFNALSDNIIKENTRISLGNDMSSAPSPPISQDIQNSLKECIEIIAKVKNGQENEFGPRDSDEQSHDPLLNIKPKGPTDLGLVLRDLNAIHCKLSRIVDKISHDEVSGSALHSDTMAKGDGMTEEDRTPPPRPNNTGEPGADAGAYRTLAKLLTTGLSGEVTTVAGRTNRIDDHFTILADKISGLGLRIGQFAESEKGLTSAARAKAAAYVTRNDEETCSKISQLETQISDGNREVGRLKRLLVETEGQLIACSTDRDNLKNRCDTVASEHAQEIELFTSQRARLQEEVLLHEQVLADRDRYEAEALDSGQKLGAAVSRMTALELSLTEAVARFAEEKASMEHSSRQGVEELQMSHISEIEAKDVEISKLCTEIQSLETTVESLKTEIGDSREDLKICEKKFVMQLKDVKRQLLMEKKRAEKLQDKFQEYLSTGGGGMGASHPTGPINYGSNYNNVQVNGSAPTNPPTLTQTGNGGSFYSLNFTKGNTPPFVENHGGGGLISPSPYLSDEDRNSVSSWSLVSSGTNTRNHDGNGRYSLNAFPNPNALVCAGPYTNGTAASSTATSKHHNRVGGNAGLPLADSSPNGEDFAATTCLERENLELIGRLASVQTDKWVLEEKVKYLEDSASSLASELVQKNGLIEHYMMGAREECHQQHHGTIQALSKSSSGFDMNEPLKKISDFVKDVKGGMTSPGYDDVTKTNRRLKVMLEETLTKNMMLEKDLETVSNEMSTLRNLQSAQMEDDGIGDGHCDFTGNASAFDINADDGDPFAVENSYYSLGLDDGTEPTPIHNIPPEISSVQTSTNTTLTSEN